MTLPASKLVKNQKITKTKTIGNERLTVTVRHDDECGNGHNTFSITAVKAERAGNNHWYDRCWGCQHDEVTRFFPNLAPLLKWHLCSTDGPMHYVVNTLYWKKQAHLKYARSCAIWPEAELEDFTEEKLMARVPALMEEFKTAVESLGLVY